MERRQRAGILAYGIPRNSTTLSTIEPFTVPKEPTWAVIVDILVMEVEVWGRGGLGRHFEGIFCTWADYSANGCCVTFLDGLDVCPHSFTRQAVGCGAAPGRQI